MAGGTAWSSAPGTINDQANILPTLAGSVNLMNDHVLKKWKLEISKK